MSHRRPSMALRKFIIERDIPAVGSFEREQLRGAAAKSNGVLRDLGPDIQWVESYVAADKTFCGYSAKAGIRPSVAGASARWVPAFAGTTGWIYRSTQAMRRMLVEPGVPNGTPAVMTTRCPGPAISSRCAVRTAFCTMSVKLVMSARCTQCAPHSNARRRAVLRFGVNARIGDAGRSRAARKAVAPELVNDKIAAAPTVAPTWLAAALIASRSVCSGAILPESRLAK